MPTILVDENIDGYAPYLARLLFSAEWREISAALDVKLVGFDDVGLARSTVDSEVWDFCQSHSHYLLTDNRNEDRADSLETTIRTRNLPTNLPVFTISDVNRLRSERDYAEAVVVKLLEYLVDADRILGTGRLYLP